LLLHRPDLNPILSYPIYPGLMLMCHKVTQENLIGGHLLFRIYS